jgi:hypothetical protein
MPFESKRRITRRRPARPVTSGGDGGAAGAAARGAARTLGAGANGAVPGVRSVGRSSNSKASIVCGLSSSTIEKSPRSRPRTRAPDLSRTTTVTRTRDTEASKLGREVVA